MRRQLVIFVKKPHAGMVKTRLGSEIGMLEAAIWFRKLSFALIRRLGGDPRWQTILAVDPAFGGVEYPRWPAGVPRMSQCGGAVPPNGDLGSRMARIFCELPPGPVIIIGTDIPGIRRDDIEQAFCLLGSRDVIFGPSRDGGFWLIGLKRLRRPTASMFEGIPWSTAVALEATEQALHDYRKGYVRQLADVDEAVDFHHLGQRLSLTTERTARPPNAPR